MGFCRRCGEIVPVQAVRCKCGGSAVAPVVQWNQAQKDQSSPDRWANTYTEKHHAPPATPRNVTPQTSSLETTEQCVDRSTSPPKPTSPTKSDSPTKLARRFPRPLSVSMAKQPITDNRVSHHIASTTAHHSTSPAKRGSVLSLGNSPGSAPADVISAPDNATLAKAYGSVLQRPETLPIRTCASCSAIFPPDATIYPDPQTPSGVAPRFFCRPCFATRGGSKGDCGTCGREVLTATREGGFVESAGKVWHKRCFRCESCYKEIGNTPMVDLFGRPSCAECFDSCLDRRGSPRSKKQPESPANNIGGLRGRSRESSPALEELSERLGIKRPLTSEVVRDPVRGLSVSPSPSPRRISPGNRDNEMDHLHRYLTGSLQFRDETTLSTEKNSSLPRRLPMPFRALTTDPVATNDPTTPDLSSASSDSLSSFAPSTPSNSPRQSLTPNSHDSITPKAKGTPTRLNIVTTDEAKCTRCLQPLFVTAGGGKIVTVPAETVQGAPASYHASCFRCFVCEDTFDGTAQGHAMFVKSSRGVSHPECIATKTHIPKPRLDSRSSPAFPSNHSPERPPAPASAPPLTKSFPRFGGSESCPGCRRPVSLMQYGVVPGPQNSRWHVNCLVCGGKGAKSPRPGCGKRLDSAAKTDREGGIWCRECMLLLPAGTCPSPQGSPTRAGLTPSHTGNGFNRFSRPEATRLFGQVTGTAFDRPYTLARQFTGGGVSPTRHGSVSPTRQMTRSVSPTKGLMPVTRHPRPAGTWKHKSVDEGRGMFLVNQMTGNGQTGY